MKGAFSSAGRSTLQPARTSSRRDAKLMIIGAGKPQHKRVSDLSALLHPSDLVIVNDVATMPSRLVGHGNKGESVEIRLAVHLGARPQDYSRWLAVSIGVGAYNTPTESRPPGLAFSLGDRLFFGDVVGEIVDLVDHEGRLFEIEFSTEKQSLFHALYNAGRPIQYAHLEERLEDWDQQTLFSGPALAVEAPSSAFHLKWKTLLQMRKRGIEIRSITHGTGLSTTGDDRLDTLLPFPERSIISKESAHAIGDAKSAGRRLIAIGTGVARAIESASLENGEIAYGNLTSLIKLGKKKRPKSVSGLLSGLHEFGTSHWNLLESFVSFPHLVEAYDEALRLGYRGHEYGDLELVFRKEH